MELQTGWSSYSSGTTTVPLYTARPSSAKGRLPAIVVIQEVWGVDAHMRDLTHRFAEAGYIAGAPDLYGHGGKRPEVLSFERVALVKSELDKVSSNVWNDPAAREAIVQGLPESQRAEAKETMTALLNPDRPIARFMSDLVAAAVHLRGMPECTGRVGSVGYCIGGMLSALLAAQDKELNGAAIYYGMSPKPEVMNEVQCPLIGFYGADDTRITASVPAFSDALRTQGKSFESHVYPNTPHAFFNDTRPSYRVDAARDAWARTLGFFSKWLT